MSDKIPWNRQDIFLDEVDQFPLYDYFPYQAEDSSTEDSQKLLNFEGV